MKKTLALLLVASLLLAGCTELAESDDGETLKIEVNEDIAIEEIKDFMTVDEDESFGITMMYDIDPAMMEMGDMLEVEEDSEAMITMEMTQAWSPDGYHMSEIMGLTNGDASMKMISTMTHVDTTMYIEIGYETQGDLCADEETEEDIAMCEMMFGNMPAVQSYSMTTTTTHTDVIAAMADETQDNSDDMDPMAMLEFLSFVECFGSFTPADSVDGLQMFDVSMEGMGNDSISPSMALCMADTDDNSGISFEEFMVVDETSQEDMDAMQTAFDDADTNSDDELTIDELEAFITAVDTYYGDDDEYEDDEGSDEMPSMKIAFNDAGGIEYFEMAMDGMGEELTVMKMYVLTETRVNSFFTDVDAGELVALPFTISDSMDGGSDDWDDDGHEPSADDVMMMIDQNEDELISWNEFEDFIINEDGGWVDDDDRTETQEHFNYSDNNSDGYLDIDELSNWLESMNDDDEDMWMCETGEEEIPMDWVNDGEEDCSDGSDEYDDDGSDNEPEMDDDDGSDNEPEMDDGEGHGDDEIVMYITSEMDFHFEGDMSDYKIELASCDYDYDMETGEETSTCTTVMSVAINDAGMDSDIMFHDADSSGTISVGDMIHIGETAESWDEVRLYSISADAYSDENPMHDAPGFTGLVGMLALLGAAFIRRNE